MSQRSIKKLKKILNSIDVKAKPVQETELFYNLTEETLDKCITNPRTEAEDGLTAYLFEPRNTEDRSFVQQHNDRAYTVIEEDGIMFIVKGFRFVNRFGYLILKPDERISY